MKGYFDAKGYLGNKIKEGWGWPGNSRKAHWFRENGMSLCRRWMYAGHLETGNDTSPDNCADCKRKLARMNAEVSDG